MILSNFTCKDVKYSSISKSTSNREGNTVRILASQTLAEHNAKVQLSVAVRNTATLALTEAQGVLITISMRHMFLQDKAVSHHCCYLNLGNRGKGFCIVVKNNETHILCAQDTVNERCPLSGCISDCVPKELL